MTLPINISTLEMNVISTDGVHNITNDVLDEGGAMKVLPADFWSQTTMEQRAIFGNKNGLYGFVTHELVEWLKGYIGDRTALEIGSGSGDLAKAVGIRATDSRMQEDPAVAHIYASLKQPIVRYGENVEKLTAAEAVRKYRPQVVVANWVTHLYREDRHAAGGNAFGVNEEDIIRNCEEYIFIGNNHVHRGKSIWNLPHKKGSPDWLFSRQMNGSDNFIAVWRGANPASLEHGITELLEF